MFKFLTDGAAKYRNVIDYYAEFVSENQLKNRKIWSDFVKVYKDKEDAADGGWRGEFWGKMMRGACLTYSYLQDEELYDTLRFAVCELLKTQDSNGEITSYSGDVKFHAWDMWCRKYVLTGALHFYGICKDENLKRAIIDAMKKHADAILEKIGDKDGQIAITDASNAWGNVNSCSILEPIAALYKITKEKRYLDFAEYIISTGGCKDGNIIKLAYENKLKPYEFPVTKAYEMISLYEGVLACYEITGKREYFDIVVNFAEAVNETEVTIVGGIGYTHELFDHAAAVQTEYRDCLMQETCVTVTWIRLLTRLLIDTGDVKYADRIEKSAFNALYGAVNVNGRKQLSVAEGKYVDALVFDSYSPLVNNIRGRAIGGFKRLSGGGYYGCCVCIGAAGTALVPLTAVMEYEDGLVFNIYAEGEIMYAVNGTVAELSVKTDYPSDGNVEIRVKTEKPVSFGLKLRIPEWCDNCVVGVGDVKEKAGQGYYEIKRTWKDGDVIKINADIILKKISLNGKTAYKYGALVLASDEAKSEGERLSGELYRNTVKIDGKDTLLTDYASCGKNWNENIENVKISIEPIVDWVVKPDDSVPKINVWFE